MDEHLKQSLRTAAIYALFAGLSMPLADALMHAVVDDLPTRTRWIAYKDWAFVVLTAMLVFYLTRRTLRAYARLLGELQRSELRFHTIFDGVGDGIFLCDPKTAAFIDVNATMARMLGYSRKELSALSFSDVSADPPPTIHREVAALIAAVQRGQTPVFEWHAKKRDGTPFWVEVDVQQGIIEGRPHVMALVRDITKRKEAQAAQRRVEDEIRHLNVDLERRVVERTAQLQAANKELDAFAFSVSHDLKAPLRRIDGYSRILIEDHAAKLDAEARGVVQRILEGIAEMHGLIQDLLAYSRMERRTLERDRLEVNAVVRKLTDEREQEIRDSGTILDVAIPALHVHADPDGFAMVLRNLIGNALKFSRASDPPTIQIGARADDGKALLWVRDNGIGFDMRYHERIFEIFQRLERHEDYPGTGVGLALVRRAVQRMDGRVWATSEPGQGATFFVELPS